MQDFFNNKTDVVRYVSEKLPSSELDSPLTMTITLGRYEEFYADIVTEPLSAGYDETTVAEFFSKTQVNT